jgi:K+-transporting ATPase ATPase C chain
MKTFLQQLRGSILSVLLLSAILCGAYPLGVWAIAQGLFPQQANGSLVYGPDGTLLGSRLLGQNFTEPTYFHPRPSAAGADGYDASSSGGSNLGPSSQKLADQIKVRVERYRTINGLEASAPVPADAVTASGSGLDPQISVANAQLQIPRVAKTRALDEGKVRDVVRECTEGPDLGILGSARVNVVRLNLALDELSAPPL